MYTSSDEAVDLLRQLIQIPSFSTQEAGAAALIQSYLHDHGVPSIRKFNNIWAYNKHFDPKKPLILLNSHLDTVQPNSQYTKNPFVPEISGDKLFGLGSNDAGASLVSLLTVFIHFYSRSDLPFNLCMAATAEEETSGSRGIRCILDDLMLPAFAIVGEPTQMHMATAERGSMVIDCLATGRSGHAARDEGDNAIYRALKDITWFSNYQFRTAQGEPPHVKMTVTEVQAGTQHNVVPGECRFTVDVRFDHQFSAREIMNVIDNHTFCDAQVRAGVLKPSFIPESHPLVRAGIDIGRTTYASPTSSDQGWLDFPSVKMGPGDSARSHTADEFIRIPEIAEGIDIYIRLLDSLFPYLAPGFKIPHARASEAQPHHH